MLNLTLKRYLLEKYKFYNTDEYRTACLSYKIEDECENLFEIRKNKNK